MEPIEPTPQGFRGTISLRLTDLIQMVCLSRSDLIIDVISHKGKGTIHIRQGQISHARTDRLSGEEAFFEVLQWNDGQFEILPYRESGINSVNKPWEYLLLEAVRHNDEVSPAGENGNADHGPEIELSADSNMVNIFDEIGDVLGDLVQLGRAGPEPAGAQPADSASDQPVRVLLVDDSSFFSKKLRDMLEGDSTIQVLNIAKNGKEALEFLESRTPIDLITLDAEMPVMPGETALKHIMIRHHLPAVIISSLQPQSMYKVFDFLQLGAVDFFPKPEARENREEYETKLRTLVRGAAKARMSRFRRLRKQEESGAQPRPVPSASAKRILLIVGAEGAHMDWFRMPLRDLCRLGLLVGLQKLPESFASDFVDRVGQKTGVATERIGSDHIIMPGKFYLGNACHGACLELRLEGAPGKFQIPDPDSMDWQAGMQLWLDRFTEQFQNCIDVFFLSSIDPLPESLMSKLLDRGIRLILTPPESVLCSQLVDSIHPYAAHFPDQVICAGPEDLPEVLVKQ